MDIYWIKDRKKCGPASVPDVVSMVHSGELLPETPGWHAGCSGWMPLRELPALADFLNTPEPAEEPLSEAEPQEPEQDNPEQLPPVPSRSEAENEEAVEMVMQPDFRLPSAGVRLLARLVDMSIYSALMFIVFFMTDTDFSVNLLPYGPMFWFGLIGMETASLHFAGTTPGKRLLGIRVFSGVKAGERMTALIPHIGFIQGMWRSFLVFIGGMGMMVYILPFIMGPLAFFMLRKRGFTTWDMRARTLPVQVQIPSLFRYLMAFIIIYASLNIVTACMTPWIPDMVQMLEEQSPEHARMLREMLPQEAMPASPAKPEPASPGIRFLEL